jgi:hypothetical protein
MSKNLIYISHFTCMKVENIVNSNTTIYLVNDGFLNLNGINLKTVCIEKKRHGLFTFRSLPLQRVVSHRICRRMLAFKQEIKVPCVCLR